MTVDADARSPPSHVADRLPAAEQSERWRRRGPLLPALVFAIVLTQVPFLLTLYYSFQSRNLLRPGAGEFVGLENYGKVFTDDLFRNAVFNTVQLTVGAVVLSMVLGVALAVLLDKQFFGRGIVRTLLITPFLVMPAAAALLWKTSMLNPVFGLLNWALSPFGVDDIDWVNRFPMASIILVLTWQWTPFMMLIVLAGLQSQSPEVLEAAKVDGARRLADVPPGDAAAPAPVHRAGRPARIDLHRADVRRDLHDHPGWSGTGDDEPAVLHLPAGVPRLRRGEAAAAGVIVVAATIVIATFALRVISNLFKEEAVTSMPRPPPPRRPARTPSAQPPRGAVDGRRWNGGTSRWTPRLGRRAVVLLPGAVDVPHRLQAGVAGVHRPADVLLHPDPRPVPRHSRPGLRAVLHQLG